MDQATKPDSRRASDVVIRRLAEGRTVRSVGVEEELLIVEPGTGRPRALAGAVIRAAGREAEEPGAGGPRADEPSAGEPDAVQPLEFELQKQQLEIDTRPCHSLDELGRELRRCRATAAAAAARAGVTVAALGTSPVAVHPEVVPTSRYQAMAVAFGLTAHEQLTCGCHVHVGISSAEEGVAVLDRIQPWLATLLALSANSPFWQGMDSAYASFRYQAWGRWPCSGPTGQFGSAEAYQATVRQMIDTRTLLDSGMVYFDARLSQHYPTIEVRIADVCQHADDAVLIAALVRGLVETEARNWQAGRPPAGAYRATAAGRVAGQPVRPGRRTDRPGHLPAGQGGRCDRLARRARPRRPSRRRGHPPGHRPARRGALPRQRRGRPALGIPAPRPPRGRHHRRRNHHHGLIWRDGARLGICRIILPGRSGPVMALPPD